MRIMLNVNNVTDTTTGFTDNANVNGVGDLQCIDFKDGGTATEDICGDCAALTLISAGQPIIEAAAGDFSMDWISNLG